MSGDTLESNTYLLTSALARPWLQPGAHSHEQERVQLVKRKWERAGHRGSIALHHPEAVLLPSSWVPYPLSLSGEAHPWQCHPQGKHCQPRTPATSKTIPPPTMEITQLRKQGCNLSSKSPSNVSTISQINLSQAAATRGGFPLPEQGGLGDTADPFPANSSVVALLVGTYLPIEAADLWGTESQTLLNL